MLSSEPVSTGTQAGVRVLPSLASRTEERQSSHPIAFRQFIAFPGARTLLRRGSPMQIGGRAFDLLVVLLRARGTLVSKRDLFREVWPETFVEEVNLRFQMAALRKLLGEDRDLIKTVPGRGYVLIEDHGLDACA